MLTFIVVLVSTTIPWTQCNLPNSGFCDLQQRTKQYDITLDLLPPNVMGEEDGVHVNKVLKSHHGDGQEAVKQLHEIIALTRKNTMSDYF